MRYAEKPKMLTTMLLAGLIAVPALGQEADQNQPNLFQQAVSALADGQTPANSTWSGMQQDPALPQAENDGSVKGSTLSERMNSIRRRAADSDISRPFNATEAGTLPAVKRRPLGPPTNLAESTGGSPSDEPARELPAAPPIAGVTEPEQPAPVRLETQPLANSAAPAAAPLEVAVNERPQAVAHRSEANRSAANVLLTNAAPALSFQTAGPRSITLGREASYQVQMMNRGQAEARNVVCSVKLPLWAEVVNQAATIGSQRVETTRDNDQLVRWEIPALAAGKHETLTLRIIPRDSRPFDLAVGWSFAPDRATAQIEVQEPKLELELNGSEEIDFGSTDVYTITISNPGSGDAENVVLNLMPMTNKQQVAGTRNLGTIAPGERKTLELELTAHQAGRLQVRAMAYADNGLRAESVQDVLVRRANLDVVVMGPPRNYAATTATYKVRVENTGNAVAEDAMATASLPAGATFVSSTDGGRYDEQRGLIEWNIGSLRPGAVRVLEMNCGLASAGENRFDFQCSSSHDVNVSKSLVTIVEALADLKLYVNDPQGAIPVGEDAEYEIRIVNRGTKAAEEVEIMGYFSHGVEPETILRGGRGEVSTGQVAFERVESIAPGQEKVFRILARAIAPGNHVFRAELQCRSPETRLAAEEWTKYYSTDGNVRQASRLEMTPAHGE